MRPVTLTVNPSAASTTKVAAAQTVLIGGSLTLTAAATAGIDASGAARILLVTTTEDDSAGNLTFTGTDADGNSQTEVLAMPNSTTKVTTKAYKTISSITTDLAITANISIGTVGTTLSVVSKTVPLDYYSRTATTVSIEVTGTINFTVNETFDPILASGTSGEVMYSVSALAAKTANTRSPITVGATGLQVQINSYSTGATLTAQIISPSNSNMG